MQNGYNQAFDIVERLECGHELHRAKTEGCRAWISPSYVRKAGLHKRAKEDDCGRGSVVSQYKV